MIRHIFFSFLLFSFFFPSFAFAQGDFFEQASQQEEIPMYLGKIEVIEEEEIDRLGRPLLEQRIEGAIIRGEKKGQRFEITNDLDVNNPFEQPFELGDKVLVTPLPSEEGEGYYIHDLYRLDGMLWMLVLFIVIGLLVAGRHSVRAFLGLGISFAALIWILFPLLFAGYSALWVCLLVAVIIASSALYLAHGMHMRIHVAFVSTMLSVVVAFIFSSLFVEALSLFGYGTEEAYFLQLREGITINIRGLLLGGMIIGVLGVLDDVTTTQAATVEQLYRANPQMSTRELYERATAVGKEHILSLINTLVLAYAGASLPLMLLFRLHQQPWWVTMNSEVVMEELARMLIGSMVLIIAVPLTTLIAVALREKLMSGEDCGHVHIH